MFLFVAPFSTDSVFITCDLNLDEVCANSKLQTREDSGVKSTNSKDRSRVNSVYSKNWKDQSEVKSKSVYSTK